MKHKLEGAGLDRRRLLVVSASAVLASTRPISAQETPPVGIGLTPVFLDDQITFLESWRLYLETKFARPVRFYQRGSYAEISRLLRDGRIDFAWTCGFPFWSNRDWMKLVVVPLYNGMPLYRSYQIRSRLLPDLKGFQDLQGRVFAFSDPDSNSGFLYPQFRLRTMGLDARTFFGRYFFTNSHRRVVEAVAVQLADAGSVDGYVWDVLSRTNPQLTERTAIFEKSPEFGFPPIVASDRVDRKMLALAQSIFTGMKDDERGQQLLAILMLDGFTVAEPALFASIGNMIPGL